MELPTSGRILLDGEDVTALPRVARDIAFVFQLFALYPHMTVRKNIGFPLKCQNVSRAQIKKSVEEAADCCGSIICSTAGPAGCPAATGSASRSAAPSCAGRKRS